LLHHGIRCGGVQLGAMPLTLSIGKEADLNAFTRHWHLGRAAAALTAMTLACASTSVWSQRTDTFPERPVRLLLAVPPGGAADLIGRALAKGLTDLWGQPVIVDHRAGAGGLLAAEATVKAAGDGYTLFQADNGVVTILPFFQQKMPYDTLTDLAPVGLIATIPLALTAHPSAKFRSLQEFVVAAKDRPGRIDYASSSTGSPGHMAMLLLERAAGIRLNHIPYKGGAPALQDVVGGHVPVMFTGVSSIAPHAREGRLVALAVGSPERSPMMPEMPTVAELGYPNFDSDGWAGIVAPRSTPPALVEKISADLQKVTRSQEYRDNLLARGNQARASTSRELADRIRAEYERNRELLKGVTAEKP
jgi:tripartite-type tricarboxylate transporter receptor subunit TctC